MSQLCILSLLLFKFTLVYGYPGETLMVMPPFEVRTLDKYSTSPQFPTSRSSYRHQEPITHTDVDHTLTPSLSNTIIEELNTIQSDGERESLQFRATNDGRDSKDSAYRPYPGPYPQPNSPGYGSTQTYQKPASTSVDPEPLLPKAALVKPDLSTLFKPVTTKVASKTSGLLSLILSLFSGSSSDGLQMKGLSELVINGILKPLLVAKGGIKSLISKLIIPLLALLLINLEVLVTVWWLWEDCEPRPIIKPSTPVYPYQKPAYNSYGSSNTYSSYR